MSVCCGVDVRVSVFINFVGGQLDSKVEFRLLKGEVRKMVEKGIQRGKSLGNVVSS